MNMENLINTMAALFEACDFDLRIEKEEVSIVKKNDDPWNWTNTWIAKQDGVYNYIEMQMGGYGLKKRVSCRDLQTATILMFAWFLREVPSAHAQKVLCSLKSFRDVVLHDVSDYDRGQYLIDSFASMTAPSFKFPVLRRFV